MEAVGRLAGEDIEHTTSLDPTRDNVRADPGSLEQVLITLVINARDALGYGGRLRIETRSVVLGERRGKSEEPGRPPGEYVVIAVSDDGVGMDAQPLRNIFEPFFTTKELGKGTGLGLSTCFGIINQAGGTSTSRASRARGRPSSSTSRACAARRKTPPARSR